MYYINNWSLLPSWAAEIFLSLPVCSFRTLVSVHLLTVPSLHKGEGLSQLRTSGSRIHIVLLSPELRWAKSTAICYLVVWGPCGYIQGFPFHFHQTSLLTKEGGGRVFKHRIRWQKLGRSSFCCRILASGSPLVLRVSQVWWLRENSGATVFI